jgi:sugar phosphate isomerase/epimerase
MLSFGAVSPDGVPNVDAPASSWASQLQEVVDEGFDFVDPTDAWLSIGELSDQRFAEFVKVVSDVGLKIPSISTTRRSVIDPKRGIDYLRIGHVLIERAPALGSTIVNFGLMQDLLPAQQKALWFWLEEGYHDPDDPELRSLAVARIRELAEHAASVGIEISLEMYEDTYIGTADEAVRFLKDVDHPAVGLNPDLGNLVRLHREIEDIPTMHAKVLPYTNFWHIKNYLRDVDPASGVVTSFPVPLVMGIINYRVQIRQALKCGFHGPFVCEHYGSDSLGVAAINREYIKGVLRSALR